MALYFECQIKNALLQTVLAILPNGFQSLRKINHEFALAQDTASE